MVYRCCWFNRVCFYYIHVQRRKGWGWHIDCKCSVFRWMRRTQIRDEKKWLFNEESPAQAAHTNHTLKHSRPLSISDKYFMFKVLHVLTFEKKIFRQCQYVYQVSTEDEQSIMFGIFRPHRLCSEPNTPTKASLLFIFSFSLYIEFV